PSRCSAVDDLGSDPAMPVSSFSLSPLPLSRRDVLIGGAASCGGLLLPSLAGAQTKLLIPEGNVAPLPIAVPDFVAGSPADGEVGVCFTHVITNDLRRSRPLPPIVQAYLIRTIVHINAAPQLH